ncbi:hypothetical protein ACFU1R_24790 [Priestia megaterium]|uniref:hypothetical protein n=1 Tax=Priestia megaterium TaxID=1404 RepID=UPI00366EBF9B
MQKSQKQQSDIPRIPIPDPGARKTYLEAHNLTGVDLWIKVTGHCVTEEYKDKPVKLLNNNIAMLDSDKTGTGNKARYHFEVWKNDDGQPGVKFEEFDIHVRNNAAGAIDVVEFWKIGDRFHAISLKQVGGKIIDIFFP